jgi:hypothetical protein
MCVGRATLATLAATLAGITLGSDRGIAGGLTTKAVLTAGGESKRFDFGFGDEARTHWRLAWWGEPADASIGRVSVHHGEVQAFGWGRFDDAYEILRARGIRPLMVLTGGRSHTMPPDEWQTLNRAFARRYPGAALKILSETNHPGFGGRFSPRQYAHRLKQAESAIRSVRPTATVIASAAAPRATYRDPHRDAVRYTRRVFNHIGPRRKIHAAAHIYPYEKRSPIKEAKNALRATRRASRGRPVWVTETALRGHIFGNGVERARKSARLLRVLRREGARAVIFWRLRDDPRRGDRDGAFDVHDKPTVLYRALRRAVTDFDFVKVNRMKRKGWARLVIRTPAAGTLRLLGTSRVRKTGPRTVGGPRRVRLLVRPKGKARRKLNRISRSRGQARVRVKARVRFAPEGGEPRVKSRRVRLIMRR